MMVTLEQVKLLESKVTNAIDYVKKVTEENSSLKGKLDSYQKRISELEVLIQQFREEQGRIEDGILSALDRLNQFEDALEKTLAEETAAPSEANASEALTSEALASRASAPARKDASAKKNGSGSESKSMPEDSSAGIDADEKVASEPVPKSSEEELDIF